MSVKAGRSRAGFMCACRVKATGRRERRGREVSTSPQRHGRLCAPVVGMARGSQQVEGSGERLVAAETRRRGAARLPFSQRRRLHARCPMLHMGRTKRTRKRAARDAPVIGTRQPPRRHAARRVGRELPAPRSNAAALASRCRSASASRRRLMRGSARSVARSR